MACFGKGALMVVLLVLSVSASERKMNGEERLVKDILRNYVTVARPAAYPTNVTTVAINMELLRIADFDSSNDVVTVNAWLFLGWEDFRLVWEPLNYDGVEQLHLRMSDVWLPDIKLFNGAKPDMEIGHTKLVADNTGNVMWVPPVKMEFPCALDHGGTKFNCQAKLGSWTYDGFQVDLVEESFKDSSMIINPRFSVSELSVIRNSVYYSCCPEPYVDVTFSFDLDLVTPEKK